MGRILLVRHGQSSTNQARIFTGQLDYDLSPLGYRQAECAMDYIAAHDAVEAIYASDLLRAVHTAQPLAERLHLPIVPMPAFREINAGAWQGQKFTDLMEDAAYALWQHDIGHCACPGGESVAQLAERVYTALTALARKHDGQTILLATHATPIRTLQCTLLHRPLAEMKDVQWVTNASLTVVEYANGAFSMPLISYDDYLADMKTTLPKEA